MLFKENSVRSKRSILMPLLMLGALLLVACQPAAQPTPETITVIETVEVVKEVEGETITVIKTVEVEVVVTEVVEVEAMVDEAACNLAAPAEATEVGMIGWAFPITEFFAAEIEKCGDVDNLSVSTQLLDSAGAQEQITLGLAGGAEAPWSIIHTAPGSAAEHGSLGNLYPLNDLIEKYWIEYNLFEIPDSVWEAMTWEGNIYGVPFIANTMHMFYRTDLFEQYNLDPPTTYDGVIEACAVLAGPGTSSSSIS